MDTVADQTSADMPPAAAATGLPAKILVRSSNWLGDAVMTIPAIRAIKRTRPDAYVTILTRDKLADFWRIVPEVDEIISIEKGDNIFAVARKIKAKFDMALLLPNSIRSAMEAYLAGIPRRVGYRGKSRKWLLSEFTEGKADARPPRHQMHHYLDLAEFAGATVDESFRNLDHALDGKPKIERTESPGGVAGIKIGVCPGAEYGPAKRWLPERFAEVVTQVSKRRECEWLFFGTQRDEEIGEKITSEIEGGITNLIGKTTMAELITALAGCRLLLTNDTGTMHLAAYLGVPTVSLFGSTEPVLTGPMGTGHRVLRHHVECSPCFLRDCPLDFRCMKAIESDEVVEAVLRMLER